MANTLAKIESSVDQLNAQLNLDAETKVRTFQDLIKTGDWSALFGVRSVVDAVDVMVSMHIHAPGLAFVFLKLTEEDILKLVGFAPAGWTIEPGIAIFYREEQ